uniref:Uncharacterized protein n=1 Tax=Glossina austeni TaxID=7395 RepID=A0A1A9VIE8_GLOAU
MKSAEERNIASFKALMSTEYFNIVLSESFWQKNTLVCYDSFFEDIGNLSLMQQHMVYNFSNRLPDLAFSRIVGLSTSRTCPLVQPEDCFHSTIGISVDIVFHTQIEPDIKLVYKDFPYYIENYDVFSIMILSYSEVFNATCAVYNVPNRNDQEVYEDHDDDDADTASTESNYQLTQKQQIWRRLKLNIQKTLHDIQ